jgi:hypothetical protein
MEVFLDDKQYKTLLDYRDFLAHRGTPPRTFFQGGSQSGSAAIASNPKDLSDHWRLELFIDDQTTSNRAKWLTDTLRDLINAAEAFCESKL